MSASSSAGPNYANANPTVDSAALATAQTAFTGLTTASSNVVLVSDNSAGATAARINDARVVAAGTLTAAVVNWWLNPSSTTLNLVASTQLAAVTPSATVAASVTKEANLVNFDIPAGAKLWATITVTENVVVSIDKALY